MPAPKPPSLQVMTMGISDDVLIIGGGMAGMAAALAAVRHGVRVRVISDKQSTLRSASGLIDVLGYLPDGTGPVSDPFDAIADLPTGHPYERVGVPAVEAGLEIFDDAVGSYEGSHTPRNALLPTHGGSIKPTARYPAGMGHGMATDSRDMLLVGFTAITDFDAPVAAQQLAALGAPFDARGVTIEFPGELRDDAKITRYANILDANEPVPGTTYPGTIRTALAAAIEPHLEREERVGLPAVLGKSNPEAVRQELGEALSVDIFEVPMGPPSLPGLRLEAELREALDEAGVRITTGNPVVAYDADNSWLQSVEVDRSGQRVTYHADQFVLATGGLVGKGIKSNRAHVIEPVFDCYVPHPTDRYDWFSDTAFGDHAFARFGVKVDSELRPLTANGHPEFENLRAAGSVLGGADFAAEKSGSGISLSTGYAAGDHAGRRAVAEGGEAG